MTTIDSAIAKGRAARISGDTTASNPYPDSYDAPFLLQMLALAWRIGWLRARAELAQLDRVTMRSA